MAKDPERDLMAKMLAEADRVSRMIVDDVPPLNPDESEEKTRRIAQGYAFLQNYLDRKKSPGDKGLPSF